MIRVLLLALSAFLVGCGEGFLTNRDIGSELPFFKESHSKSFIPEMDQVDSDCQKSGEICIFLKNPAFQEKRTISATDLSSLKKAQQFSARLTNLDLSGFVKNSNFDILSVDDHQRLRISDALSQRGIDDDLYQAHFLNSYYWLNRAHEYLKKNFGDYPSSNIPLKVIVDDGFDGFNYSARTLSLDLKKRSALSGEVALLLLGEAQLGFASKGTIYDFDETTHSHCSGDPKGCCKNENGCAKAILRGSGDIFVSMLFQDAQGIGEFHFQDLKGQSVCGLSRNPSAFKDVKFADSNSLCTAQRGSALSLGMVYASIWNEVRSKSNSTQVDKVFLKHLYKLNGKDDFNSALQKIQETCLELGYSELSTVFANEFARRR